MKTLHFNKLDFGEEQYEILKNQDDFKGNSNDEISKTVFKNLFSNACRSKFVRGATLEENRVYSGVMDSIDNSKNNCIDFSDDKFDFICIVFETSLLPINTIVPIISDWLNAYKDKPVENKV